MAMSLAKSRVTRQKIEISFTLHIPKVNAFASIEYHRQRVIVVCSVMELSVDEILCLHILLFIGYKTKIEQKYKFKATKKNLTAKKLAARPIKKIFLTLYVST
jgi:hypothetical protein